MGSNLFSFVVMTRSELIEKCTAKIATCGDVFDRTNTMLLFVTNNFSSFLKEVNPCYDPNDEDYSIYRLETAFVWFVENKPYDKEHENAFFVIKHNFGDWILSELPEMKKKYHDK